MVSNKTQTNMGLTVTASMGIQTNFARRQEELSPWMSVNSRDPSPLDMQKGQSLLIGVIDGDSDDDSPI